jgi:hypothetical protein
MTNRITPSVREQLADPAFRARIRSADVVLGVSIEDPDDRRLFYGERAAPRPDARVVEVQVDFTVGSQDAQALAAYVLYARGSTCYPSAEVDERRN